jgi:signal transduction histidine kinase
LKFTPSGGRIEVSARRQGQDVLFRVSDTGVGIPAEDQAEVFEKFSRSRSPGRESGVGLGLALVKSLIELHGGEVRLVSSRGEGTTVTCRVPAAAAGAAARQAAQA